MSTLSSRLASKSSRLHGSGCRACGSECVRACYSGRCAVRVHNQAQPHRHNSCIFHMYHFHMYHRCFHHLLTTARAHAVRNFRIRPLYLLRLSCACTQVAPSMLVSCSGNTFGWLLMSARLHSACSFSSNMTDDRKSHASVCDTSSHLISLPRVWSSLSLTGGPSPCATLPSQSFLPRTT